MAGALRVQVVGSTNPDQYTLDVGVLLLAMLVVGGMRTVTGAFVGTALITIGNEIARQLGDDYEIERLPELFLGAVLLAVMLWRPGGLLGDIDVRAWLRRRMRAASAPAADATTRHRRSPTTSSRRRGSASGSAGSGRSRTPACGCGRARSSG